MSRYLRRKIARKLGFGYSKRDVLKAERKGYERASKKFFEKKGATNYDPSETAIARERYRRIQRLQRTA